MPDNDDAARSRAVVLAALLIAIERRDALLAALWQTEDEQGARDAVQRVLGVSEVQARAVLDLQLRRFTPATLESLRAEYDQLRHLLED
ncbi:hypothetical protein [Prauserella cavernicola]|uniref:DNA topoisomerase (ATP-hydrolyzing) n=1 Tax=Prauserella cavernicola TaxID=2800127 RepID=A0A934V3F2_9PSEU|nr:hypothetical protein [Prauserella cavernicola]MBK1783609.1 hypothetical protein [Prauserella cavernicola]